jgi:hypothetical protein
MLAHKAIKVRGARDILKAKISSKSSLSCSERERERGWEDWYTKATYTQNYKPPARAVGGSMSAATVLVVAGEAGEAGGAGGAGEAGEAGEAGAEKKRDWREGSGEV